MNNQRREKTLADSPIGKKTGDVFVCFYFLENVKFKIHQDKTIHYEKNPKITFKSVHSL